MVRSTSPGGTTQYAYDAMGNRVLKTDFAGSTRYLVDPFGVGGLSQVLRETGASGSVDYVLGGGTLVSMRRFTGTSFYLHDGQMSTRMLADAAGNVTDRYDYDAFGNVLSQAGSTPNSYLYGGQQLDPNLGFYHLRARYYDPTAGRFTAPDPFPGIIFDPPSLHPYTYAQNDPVNKSDPSGQFSLVEQMIVVSTVGVLSGIAYAAQNYYYYRNAELAFEIGVDAAFSYASLAMDMIGAGALVRGMVAQVIRGVTGALAGRTVLQATGSNIGKSIEQKLVDVAEKVLCRRNNAGRCFVLAVELTGAEAKALVEAGVREAAEAAARKKAAQLLNASWSAGLNITAKEFAEITIVAIRDGARKAAPYVIPRPFG